MAFMLCRIWFPSILLKLETNPALDSLPVCSAMSPPDRCSHTTSYVIKILCRRVTAQVVYTRLAFLAVEAEFFTRCVQAFVVDEVIAVQDSSA
jgi:hypothetical protein